MTKNDINCQLLTCVLSRSGNRCLLDPLYFHHREAPAGNSRYTIHHTDDSAGELIKQVNACVQTHSRIAISVTSYENVDRVKGLLDAVGIEHPTKNVAITLYITFGYLLQQKPLASP